MGIEHVLIERDCRVILQLSVVLEAYLPTGFPDEFIVDERIDIEWPISFFQYAQCLFRVSDRFHVLRFQTVIACLDPLRAMKSVVDLGFNSGPLRKLRAQFFGMLPD